MYSSFGISNSLCQLALPAMWTVERVAECVTVGKRHFVASTQDRT